MRNIIKSRVAAVSVGALIIASFAGVGGAVAGSLVTSQDIKNGTVRSIDVANGTLGMRDLNTFTKSRINQPGPAGEQGEQGEPGRNGADGKDGATGAQGPAGAAGPAGPAGAQGPAGKAGADGKDGVNGKDGVDGQDGADGEDGQDGVSGYEVLNREARWSSTAGTVVAPCTDGKVALGGGFVVEGIRGGDAVVKSSQPVYSNGVATGWSVAGSSTGEANVKAWVTCATVN